MRHPTVPYSCSVPEIHTFKAAPLPGEVRAATRAIWTLAVRNAQQSSISVNNIINVNMVITMLLQAFAVFSRMEH
jgi:hypothetical protein